MIRLGPPAHEIVTKTVCKTLPGVGGYRVTGGGGGPGVGGYRVTGGSGGPGVGGYMVTGGGWGPGVGWGWV